MRGFSARKSSSNKESCGKQHTKESQIYLMSWMRCEPSPTDETFVRRLISTQATANNRWRRLCNVHIPRQDSRPRPAAFPLGIPLINQNLRHCHLKRQPRQQIYLSSEVTVYGVTRWMCYCMRRMAWQAASQNQASRYVFLVVSKWFDSPHQRGDHGSSKVDFKCKTAFLTPYLQQPWAKKPSVTVSAFLFFWVWWTTCSRLTLSSPMISVIWWKALWIYHLGLPAR
ncbi:hypothetical protein BDV29DRAFT_176347 [Aspergillus leporis]|uniref:Uncharacterized protein n=1 Tax=Aspergillus leporis TaxID=41062 RepID=A0A5N5WWN0_9EURO|nr:hypothetical protein BDV29DRAFT_176347 [Aspergillus leporis]